MLLALLEIGWHLGAGALAMEFEPSNSKKKSNIKFNSAGQNEGFVACRLIRINKKI